MRKRYKVATKVSATVWKAEESGLDSRRGKITSLLYRTQIRAEAD